MPGLSTTTPDLRGLYCDHHRWLQAWLLRRLGNEGDAADLAHDTFLRLLRRDVPGAGRAAPVTPLREPRAYLTTIASGLLVSHLRRKALEKAYLEALAALPQPQAISPEQQLGILQTLHALDAMLHTLQPRVRAAFLMARLDGMKQQDIATALGISLPTVKKYMRKAWLACLCLMDDDASPAALHAARHGR